jgi:hypothetical protein
MSRFARALEHQSRGWPCTAPRAPAPLMRIAWRSVGGICERVNAEAAREGDLLAGLAQNRDRRD